MTIAVSTNRVQYTADGVVTDFPFEFPVLEDDHMVVTEKDILGNERTVDPSEYTLTGIGTESGSVNYLVAPSSPTGITLTRLVPISQLTDYVPYDAFPAETHELALDKLTMICQQLDEELGRALVLPPGAPGSGIIVDLPAAENRGYSALHFSEDGTTILADYEIGHFKGDWSTGTTYKARQTLSDPATDNLYLVISDHIATNIADGVTNGDLLLIMDFATMVVKRDEAVIAADAALISQTESKNSEVLAKVSEDNSAIAEINSYNWAQADEDLPVDDGVHPVGFSAFHYAEKAQEILDLGGNIAISAQVTDTGSNDFITDVNLMDFTGHQFADATVITALDIGVNNSLSLTHLGNLWQYQGTRPTLIGLGGTTQVSNDWAELTSSTAASVSVDNTNIPGSSATNVQDALEGLATRPAASIVYDNAQGFPVAATVQAALDEVGQYITEADGWSIEAKNADHTLAGFIGHPKLYTNNAAVTVRLPANTVVDVGTVFSFVSPGGFEVTFDVSTHAQTITVPFEKTENFRGTGCIKTITYLGSNTWLLYGDLEAA